MKEYIRFMEGIHWIFKLILSVVWFFNAIYRIFKGLVTKNDTLVLIGVLWIFLGWVGMLIDVVSILQHKKLVYFV